MSDSEWLSRCQVEQKTDSLNGQLSDWLVDAVTVQLSERLASG